nr:MAG TPA: hypothetical protein [Caudoviricetes sp.]
MGARAHLSLFLSLHTCRRGRYPYGVRSRFSVFRQRITPKLPVFS